ncbi:MAG: hypothetical protein AWU57_558 [Marinobacter sp. T13-3]|nr:MAG: hypothetical protein AWU57_558 [Marinobacter sp. T13-3]
MRVTISIDWNTEGMDLPAGHEDALKESGIERALSMANEGYVQGELNDNIHMNDDDPEEGVEYHGWWSLSVERDPQPNKQPS